MNEAFWPLFKNYAPQQASSSPDVESRRQSLIDFGVNLDEYDARGYLERAIICPSVEEFLWHVQTRGGYLTDRAPRGTLTQCRYIRYRDRGSSNFVRWLHTDRKKLRSSFIRWCLSVAAKTHLSPDDTGTAPLVWKGIIPEGQNEMPFPEHAPYFDIFSFANSWYLVPITSLEMRRPIELQFWWLEGKAWHNRWTQQGEVVLRIYEDVDKDPYRQDNFVNVLGAVGPLLPGLTASAAK